MPSQWIGGWVGCRAGLDAVEKRKIPAPLGVRTAVIHLVASDFSDILTYFVLW